MVGSDDRDRLELRKIEAILPLVFVNFQDQELQLLLDLPLELVKDDPNTLLFVAL